MMTVTESTIPVGDTGKLLDAVTVEQGDGTAAEREAVVVTDPENNDARANVVQSEADVDQYAALVHLDENMSELLKNIMMEMRLLNARFEEAFRTNIRTGDQSNET